MGARTVRAAGGWRGICCDCEDWPGCAPAPSFGMCGIHMMYASCPRGVDPGVEDGVVAGDAPVSLMYDGSARNVGLRAGAAERPRFSSSPKSFSFGERETERCRPVTGGGSLLASELAQGSAVTGMDQTMVLPRTCCRRARIVKKRRKPQTERYRQFSSKGRAVGYRILTEDSVKQGKCFHHTILSMECFRRDYETWRLGLS